MLNNFRGSGNRILVNESLINTDMVHKVWNGRTRFVWLTFHSSGRV